MGRPREITPEERAELIEKGYRPVEIWVPDATNEAYLTEARRQAIAAVEADRIAGIEELTDPSAYDSWDKP
jgi:Protein  of unknown function (DUF3018)